MPSYNFFLSGNYRISKNEYLRMGGKEDEWICIYERKDGVIAAACYAVGECKNDKLERREWVHSFPTQYKDLNEALADIANMPPFDSIEQPLIAIFKVVRAAKQEEEQEEKVRDLMRRTTGDDDDLPF